MSATLPANVLLSAGVSRDHADYPADPQVMAALARAEDGHFWHASRNAFIVERLRRLKVPSGARVLDAGCGGGCVSAAMQRAGYAVTGVDGHLDRVLLAASRAPEARFWVHDLSQGYGPLEGELFDAALLFDVIEHLEDPVAALAAAARRVRPGGLVAGTVPALRSLWSEVDVLAGHKKRYGLEDLSSTVDAVAGLERVEVSFFFRHLVPLMAVQRRMLLKDKAAAAEENLKIPGFGLNTVLRWAGALERGMRPVLDRLPVPGASLWFAARRTG